MKTDDLRKLYLDFFKAKNHKVFGSDSLVPANDPSLLFTGAGMNQFKAYFLGLKKDVKRAASCQKCLRTADLDRVGKTAYHHTFFEMLGNFSFGDYFKEEAIAWGWEFVTKELGLPEKKLWVSVFESDDEAFNIWKNKIGLPKSRIVRMGPEDNFWPANAPKDGPNGPCGPCSEIYVGEVPGKGVEIWNLVFTQFDRQSDGSLKDLPQRNIDTGMGLERTASVLQGVVSNYDIDIFQEIRKDLKRLLKNGSAETAHENAVMDHVRAVTFSIADGALPSNEGRGYVIRKLIRLGSDHLAKAGARESGNLHKLVSSVVRVMGATYPEIASSEKNITEMIRNEEESFLEISRIRIPKLRAEYSQIKNKAEAARIAFMYQDTYGLPREISESIAAEHGLLIDGKLFEELAEEQRKRSREHSKIAGEIFSKDDAFTLIEGLPASKFLGYEKTEATGKLLKAPGPLLIFEETPFYAESGGQMGDAGEISGKNFKAKVVDTQFIDKCIAHKVEILEGAPKEGETYLLKVDAERRADIMKNHTATHLLHSALRKVLGEHVKQSGSLVAPDRLRFDFTHFKAVDPETLAKIEGMVSAEIQKNTVVDKRVVSKDEALREGAIAFFGEKYGDEVRVLTIGDFSKELCGGTHLRSTGEIGTFKVTSESSIQAGVRRIEAVTGRWAEKLKTDQENEIKIMASNFGVSEANLADGIQKLREKVSLLTNSMANSRDNKIRVKIAEDLKLSKKIGEVIYLTETIPGADAKALEAACNYLKGLGMPYAALMISTVQDKMSFVVSGSSVLINKGFNSGQIVKEISSSVGGSGGGRPDFAVGGLKGFNSAEQIEKILSVGTARIVDFIKKLPQ